MEKLPASQGTQVVGEVAPCSADAVPGANRVQAGEPEALEKEPALHARQAVLVEDPGRGL